MMNRFLKTNCPASGDALLLVLRVGVAVLMLTHGMPKLMMAFGNGPILFPPVFGLSSQVSLLLAVGAEVGCSLLVLTGTLTRLAVIPLIITMLVAVFIIHGTDPFVKKEPALVYLLIYTTILVGGAGRCSVDNFLRRKGHIEIESGLIQCSVSSELRNKKL